MMERTTRSKNKPGLASPRRGALPLVTLAVTLFLTSSILNAGALPEAPNTSELQAGTGGNEKYAVEYQDGSEVNTDCGFLLMACAGAGAVVIDIEETFILFDFMGEAQIEVTIGASIAVAASGGFAYSLPTGSVWARGWGEVMGGEYSEYHRNGFLDGGVVDDDGCFKPVPGQVAKCDDRAAVPGPGGRCVRALAQAKASNAVDHAVSQRSNTAIYAAAHTESKCSPPDAAADILKAVDELVSPQQGSSSAQSHEEMANSECWGLPFHEFPTELQGKILIAAADPTREKLNLRQVTSEAKTGGVEEKTRLWIVEELIGGVEHAVSSQTFTVCPES